MIYQEELRKGETIALWVGDFRDEASLVTYLAAPFEEDFGFLLARDEPPEYACSFPAPANRRRLASQRPFEVLAVEDLLDQLPFGGTWRRDAVVECRRLGLPSAKSAIAFRNLSYRPKLGVNPNAPLRFVGNFPWPEGRETWEASEQLRLHRPPFPKLIKQHLTEGDGRIISWDGIVRLRSWTGFASDADLSSSGWVPTRGRRPEGDLRLVVDPSKQSPFEPTEVQARTFQSLLDQEATYLEHVLQGIFDVYPSWRENYFGERVSSDGGKTWKTGWELPEQYPPQEMPELSHPSELRRLIQPATVYVLANEEDGFTRVGFGFSCKWDEEHGLGVSTHRGAVLEVGGEEVAFEDH